MNRQIFEAELGELFRRNQHGQAAALLAAQLFADAQPRVIPIAAPKAVIEAGERYAESKIPPKWFREICEEYASNNDMYPGAATPTGNYLWPKIFPHLKKLQDFKDYVHQRLDEFGVPTDPDPQVTAATGCRISGRLGWLQAIRVAAGLSPGDESKVTAESLVLNPVEPTEPDDLIDRHPRDDWRSAKGRPFIHVWLDVICTVERWLGPHQRSRAIDTKSAAQQLGTALSPLWDEVVDAKPLSIATRRNIAMLPPQFESKVQDWLKANDKRANQVLSGTSPLGMVGTWIERAEHAEEVLRKAPEPADAVAFRNRDNRITELEAANQQLEALRQELLEVRERLIKERDEEVGLRTRLERAGERLVEAMPRPATSGDVYKVADEAAAHIKALKSRTTSLEQAVLDLRGDRNSWKTEWDSLVRSWIFELGLNVQPKRLMVDALVSSTRQMMANSKRQDERVREALKLLEPLVSRPGTVRRADLENIKTVLAEGVECSKPQS